MEISASEENHAFICIALLHVIDVRTSQEIFISVSFVHKAFVKAVQLNKHMLRISTKMLILNLLNAKVSTLLILAVFRTAAQTC